MITTLWDNTVSSKQQNSPYQTPAGAQPAGALQIVSAAAETGILEQQIDLGSVQNMGDYVSLELEIANPAGAAPSA